MVKDLGSIEDDWVRRGFTFGLWTDEPKARWDNYVHDVDELFMVVDGDVELEIGGRRLKPAPFKEVLIPARTYHSVRNIGSEQSHWLYGYKTGAQASRRRKGNSQ